MDIDSYSSFTNGDLRERIVEQNNNLFVFSTQTETNV